MYYNWYGCYFQNEDLLLLVIISLKLFFSFLRYIFLFAFWKKILSNCPMNIIIIILIIIFLKNNYYSSLFVIFNINFILYFFYYFEIFYKYKSYIF